MNYKTIFFDFGNTLVYLNPGEAEIFVQLLQKQGFVVGEEAVREAFKAADAFYRQNLFAYNGRSEEFWLIYNGIMLKELGIADPDRRLAKAIMEGFEGFWHLYPETRTVLEGLHRRGYKLGLISNSTDEIRKRLDYLDLAKYFASITYSQEAGAEKPDPRIFRIALARTGCPPKEAIHVGDDYEADVLGAAACDITPILVDRNNQHVQANCLRVQNLHQIEEILSRG